MSTEAQYRATLKGLMERSVQDEATYHNWNYVFARPQTVQIEYTSHLVRPGVDCGDGCRVLCWTAKVPDDPAGTKYANYGNSSSIYFHLHHPNDALDQAEIGDILTFGFYSGEHHAAMVYKYDPNPALFLLWNMGTQGQPVWSTLAAEMAYHAGQTVSLCKLNLPPDPAPTHEDELRAMTGFFAWEAWRLGEGVKLWLPYGKMNPKVRPNVPKKISTEWWAHNKAFMDGRKKGNAGAGA